MHQKRKRKTAGQRRAAARRSIVHRPGVIQSIVDILKRAGEKDRPVSTEQILTQLAKKYPDRDEAGMEITVRAQLSRLPKERGLEITKLREGRIVRYAAA